MSSAQIRLNCQKNDEPTLYSYSEFAVSVTLAYVSTVSSSMNVLSALNIIFIGRPNIAYSLDVLLTHHVNFLNIR